MDEIDPSLNHPEVKALLDDAYEKLTKVSHLVYGKSSYPIIVFSVYDDQAIFVDVGKNVNN